MDPDLIRQLNESISELRETVAAMSGGMTNLALGMRGLGKGLNDTTKGAKEAGNALDALAAAEEEIEKQEKEAAATRQATMARAQAQGLLAITSLTGAFFKTEAKLTNFNEGLGAAGDAAFLLAGLVGGPLGLAIGVLLKGATMAGQASLQQAQSVIDANKQLNQLGGVGAYTTKSLLDMAHDADLTSKTMDRLIKPIQSLGSNIMILGTTAGDSQKSFAKLVHQTDDERAKMMRLGISQEEYMQGTADYVALQAMSGMKISTAAASIEKLRLASTAYQENLLDLAALSGTDVKTVKEKQEALMKDRQYMTDNIMLQRKASRLTEEASHATGAQKEALLKSADSITKELESRKAGMQTLATAPKQFSMGVKEMLTTGSVSGKNAQVLARMGMLQEVEAYTKTIKAGGNGQEAAAKLMTQYTAKLGTNIDSMGTAFKFMTDDQADAMGNSADTLKYYMEQTLPDGKAKDQAKELKDIQAARILAETGGIDKARDGQAAYQNLQIAAGKGLDVLTEKFNPLIGDMDKYKIATVALTAAAVTAAAALGAMALSAAFGKGGGGGMGGMGGKLGAGGLGSRLAKGAGIGGVAAVGGLVASAAGDMATEAGYKKTGAGLQVGGKALEYAGMGAMIGSVIPGAGTLVGAGVGAALGAGVGLYENWGALTAKDPGSPSASPAKGAGPTIPKVSGQRGEHGSSGPMEIKPDERGKDTEQVKGGYTQEELAKMGLKIRGHGDVQAPNAELDNSLLNLAMRVQDKIPGFKYFSSLNDSYHQVKRPGSKHATGDAIDFTLAQTPTREEGNEIKKMLKGMGFGFVQDEYNDAKGYTTAGHIHAQISAKIGGIASGPTSGYPATLHGNEAIVPLDPTSILAELGKKSATTVSADFSKNNESMKQLISINQGMVEILSKKLDSMIDHLSASNNTQSKILKRTSV